MKCGFTGRRFELRVHRDAGHPSQAVAGEHQRPAVAFLARHLGVDEDVLQLSRPRAAGRPHAEAGPPKGSNVIDLMAALKKSLGDEKKGKAEAKSKKSAKKSSARKEPAKAPARKRA